MSLTMAEVEEFNCKLRGEIAEEIRLTNLHDDIIQTFNGLIIKINSCDDASVRVAAWNMVNKIYKDFQEECASADELNSIKTMMVKVMNALEGIEPELKTLVIS